MKKTLDRKRVTLYAGIGLVFLLLWLFSDLAKNPDSFGQRALNNIWRVSYVVVLNYVLFEFTLARVSWKRIFSSLFLFVAHVMLYSWGLYAWRFIGIQLGVYTALKTFPSAEAGATEQMGFSVMSIFFFGVIRHIYDFIQLKHAAQQLRIEKQEAELNYLKSQTNPHFLFNTLNNIYSLARDKSDLAPESILRLSKILRFMLYEAGGSFVAIEQELKIISDYLALEQLRYDETLRVNFNYDVEDMKQALPPLLLMPLVENAFKHGVSETRDQPFVDIHLSVNKRQLVFIVKNSTEASSEERPVKENIGLSNLRRQLELLYTDYSLSVQPGDYVFTATLKINLASHV
ncbi:sensor histidine kinase [Rufibacter aurantiacus]|uniref:sensor histidine kinase n=1 Tax=Rufibacter aurantiacus TaxID=2817374 RepID=UPI001B300EBE|nr:histidine kinase [Rufibacter aurantiacus]